MFLRMPRFFWISLLMLPVLLMGLVRQAAAQGIPTSTPLPDGAIVHIVAEGESLAMIAASYGVSMEEIRGLNGMAPTSNLIFPGQKLIIRLAPTVTLTPTITPVTPRPTRTPTPVTPTRTPAPTRTPLPTSTPTPTLSPLVAASTGLVTHFRRPLLIGMIVVCALGLIWTLWAGFRKE